MRAALSRQPSLLESALAVCRSDRKRAIGVTLVLTTAIAIVDFWTGDQFPLIVCYLPLVMIVCWISHVAVGVSVAMACCTGWLVDDLLLLENARVTPAEIWTAVTHFLFFLVIIGMLMRLRAAQEREEQMARTDSLTGLANNKAFREAAEEEVCRARRTGAPLAVAYLDCDNFKEVNDTYGHQEGDSLLKAIGESMQLNVRDQDVPARMGGDEFAILLPEATRPEAEAVIHRLRTRLHDMMKQHEWPVTFSIGVVVYENIPESVDELINGSDLLMFEVKRQQKDAVAYKLCV